MPTSVKDRPSVDWQLMTGLSFPEELFINVLVEDAEQQLVAQARELTWRLVTGRHPSAARQAFSEEQS